MALNWPSHFERTPPGERRQSSPYQVSLADAVGDLEVELDRLDADTWTPEIGNQHTKTNGMPLHNANPDDPGFVLKWMMDDENFAVACDHFVSLRDNVRTVGLWVNETRMRSKRPVETGDVAFATARLPAGEEDAVAADPPPHEVLDVDPDAPDAVVKGAYRAKMKQVHTDRGGSDEAMKMVTRAKEQLIGDE